MTQRTALFLATALTVCVLVVGAGIALARPDKHVVSAASGPTATVPDMSSPAMASTQDTAQLLQQRDAQYRAELDKANAQLQQAYQTIQTLKAQNQNFQQREVVYQQRLGEAVQYIQFIQNQILQGAVPIPGAQAGEGGDDHD